MLRSAWQLNRILSEDNEKNRDDLRHHAVDALIVAMSSESNVQMLSNYVSKNYQLGKQRFISGHADFPWENFHIDVNSCINKINISHRITHTLAGPMHAETIYSKPILNTKGETVHHVRKQLHKLSDKEITSDQIVDPVSRKLIQDKYKELGGKDPAKLFSDENNHPRQMLNLKDGTTFELPIHKVRVQQSVNPRTVGAGINQRLSLWEKTLTTQQ